jgi:hypothetical protein
MLVINNVINNARVSVPEGALDRVCFPIIFTRILDLVKRNRRPRASLVFLPFRNARANCFPSRNLRVSTRILHVHKLYTAGAVKTLHPVRFEKLASNPGIGSTRFVFEGDGEGTVDLPRASIISPPSLPPRQSTKRSLEKTRGHRLDNTSSAHAIRRALVHACPSAY